MRTIQELTPEDAARFESYVDRSGPVIRQELGRCWLWIGCHSSDGYGNFRLLRRPVGAHRVAWRLWCGDPADQHVLHRCDNPACVNPGHLFLGDHADNMRDCSSKGRMLRSGERNGRAALSWERVAEMRRLYASGARQVDLARQFGMSQQQVSNVVRGAQWVSVDTHPRT